MTGLPVKKRKKRWKNKRGWCRIKSKAIVAPGVKGETDMRTGRRRIRRRKGRKRMLALAGLTTAVCGWAVLATLPWPGSADEGGLSHASSSIDPLCQDELPQEHRPPELIYPEALAEAPDMPADVLEDSASAAGRTAGTVQLTAAPDGYFNDALFIGDSRTQGLELYGGIDGATFYTATGLMVNTALVKTVVPAEGGNITIPEALSKNTFGKVYIMLGVNELGWKSQDRFIDYYGQLIDTVRAKQPDAVIYIQSIMPVSREKSEKDEIYNNTRIALYNKCIQTVIEDRDVVWLDVGAAMSDESGCLPDEATNDGVHLTSEYCRKWADFLRSNTVAVQQ